MGITFNSPPILKCLWVEERGSNFKILTLRFASQTYFQMNIVHRGYSSDAKSMVNKKADKGCCVVVQVRFDYLKTSNRIEFNDKILPHLAGSNENVFSKNKFKYFYIRRLATQKLFGCLKQLHPVCCYSIFQQRMILLGIKLQEKQMSFLLFTLSKRNLVLYINDKTHKINQSPQTQTV